MDEPDADAAAEVASLAYGHLGFAEELFYAPDISPTAEAIARALIAPALPPDEPLLVLDDETFFGTGTHGFVVTPQRLCFRSALGAPRAIAWSALRAELVTVRDGQIQLGGDRLPVRTSLVEGMARFLEEMARRRNPKGGTPYRRGAVREPEAGPVTTAVVLALWRGIGAVSGLRYHPFVAPARLARARAALRGLLPADETPAALHEETLDLRPQGFVVTAERLAWYTADGERRSDRWVTLGRLDIMRDDDRVRVRGEVLPWTMMLGARARLPDAIVATFQQLVTKPKGRARRV